VARTPEEILRDAGIEFRVHAHVPVATVAEILEELPFPAEEHVKTLAFDTGDGIALAALRGGDRLQFGKLARVLGVGRDRLTPLSPERVRKELGLEPGGVCPLVDRDDVKVVLDARVLELERAFCGSGRNDATFELAPSDLIVASRATVADLAIAPQW
jgi:prolyl-tRNA editing enzyme YbaK/EbsC (Cys-tRNA(Pro) deacylase)